VRGWAEPIGLAPAVADRFCGQQIEASKYVQRGVHRIWTAQPELCPEQTVDLAGRIRPELDELTQGMLRQLAAIEACGEQVSQIGAKVLRGPQAWRVERLDQLHWQALLIALGQNRYQVTR
jgi:chorismate mutase